MTEPEHSQSQQSHSSLCRSRRSSPCVCDPSNGKRCIMEKGAGELMKRPVGWHFQSDVCSSMTFTEREEVPVTAPHCWPLHIITCMEYYTRLCVSEFAACFNFVWWTIQHVSSAAGWKDRRRPDCLRYTSSADDIVQLNWCFTEKPPGSNDDVMTLITESGEILSVVLPGH